LTGNVAEPFGLPQGSPNTQKNLAQRRRAAKKNEDIRRLQSDDFIKAGS